jgi:hypothetical protein
MTRSRFRIVAIVIATAAAAIAAPPSRATSMSAPVNLATMVHDAPVIVRGIVSSVRTARTGQLGHVEVTLDVVQGVRGVPDRTFTFRQIGLGAPDGAAADGRVYLGGIPGMPHYAKGQQVLLFLGPESAAGFRTPIGLAQGKFDIAAGNAQNGTGNRDLFRSISTGEALLTERQTAMLETTRGAISAETLTGLVQRAVDENWWGAPGAPGTGSLDDSISLDTPVQKRRR